MSNNSFIEQLLSSMVHKDPLAGLMHRAARLCGGSVLLISAAGEVVYSAGSAPKNLIARWAVDGESHTGFVGRWHVILRPIQIAQFDHDIVIATTHAHASAPHDIQPTRMLDALELVITSFMTMRSVENSSRVAESSRLMRSLIHGIQPAREASMWRALEPFGFVPYEPVRVARVRTTHQEGTAVSSLVTFGDSAMLVWEHSVSHSTHEATLLYSADTESLTDAFGFTHDTVVGISEPFVALSRTPEMLNAADTATHLHQRNPHTLTIVKVDQLQPHEWAVARLSSQHDQTVVGRFRKLLTSDREVWQTVQVHFSDRMKIEDTALRLNVHPNTVRYRLSKLETLTGRPLTDPTLIADIVMTLRTCT